MGEHLQTMTPKEIAERLGVGTDAVRMKYKRMFPERPFDANETLPSEIFVRLLSDGRKKAQPKKGNKTRNVAEPKKKVEPQPTPEPEWVEVVTDKPAPEPEPEEETWTQEQERPFYRRAILIALLIAPTAASVSNMYSVTGEITGEPITAALYTVILSVSALGFTLSGVRSWVTVLLSVILIAYESFCNLTRLYHGLMGGVKGNPTRFLGTVTELFDSGSYGTAVIIAGFSALMLAAVQYTAIFEIQKR